jgi:hypothetical protein
MTRYIYSGAELFDEATAPWTTSSGAGVTVASPPEMSDALGRVVRTAAHALSFVTIVGIATTWAAPAHDHTGEANPIVELDDDALLARIWAVDSDGVSPTTKSRERAAEILEALRSNHIEPERVLADPDGGIALYVFGTEQMPSGARSRYARIGVTNDGEVLVLCADRATGTNDVWTMRGIGRAIGQIQEFITAARANV